MRATKPGQELKDARMTTALEKGFPSLEISRIAMQESWRKEIYRPIYHIHKWWANRLGSVFRAITLAALSPPNADTWQSFYKTQHFAGKIVLDPFMGSGTTLGEVIKLGAKAIGCDVNPVSTFLVQQEFTRVPEVELRAALDHLASTVALEILHFHQTRDPQTGEMIPAMYYFWVKTVATPDGETVPLFSSYVFSHDACPKRKPFAHIVCPSCWSVLEDRYDATDIQCPCCLHRFNPQEGPASGQYVMSRAGHRYRIKDLVSQREQPPVHRLYAIMALRPDGEKVYLPARDEDRKLYAEAELKLRSTSLPLPSLDVRPGRNTDQARGYNYLHWRDFFNSRQLLCLGLLLKAILEIENQAVREQMLCLFSSTLEFNNLFCSFKGEGTGAVRHMFSNHILKPERAPLENSVWGVDKSSGTFNSLFNSRLIPAKRYLDQPFEITFSKASSTNSAAACKTVASDPILVQQVRSWHELVRSNSAVMVLNGDSSSLPLPNESVDAVVTDPPYFDFVHYSELSDFFFAWLSPVLKPRYPYFDRPDSSDPGEVQNVNPHTFATQLGHVFTECNRVLKNDGVLTFSFHHSKPEGWAAIYEAVAMAGFTVVAAYPVYAELSVSSPKSAAKEPISLDSILVCKKQDREALSRINLTLIADKATVQIDHLRALKMKLTSGDVFVVVAAETLVALSGCCVGFDAVCEAISSATKVAERRDATRAAEYMDMSTPGGSY